jgi:ParB family transcriptional regulator, chromosome partitioning protein
MKKGLGKGLGALLGVDEDQNEIHKGLLYLKIHEIEPNIDQPRKSMNDQKLQELSESIKHHGIVQPIIVKNEEGVYRIIAGERRWRAARLAGLNEVPVIVKDLSNKQIMEVALIENIQREDLNVIEEAEAYDKLILEHNITHDQLSAIIGKSRPTISNTLRLLALCEDVKKMLIRGDLTGGHARTLLAIQESNLQRKVALQVVQNNLSVRETENLVKGVVVGKRRKKSALINHDYEYLANDLQSLFGTKVKILGGNQNKGKITIEYYSVDDLDRIVNMVNTIKDRV